ncbi:MAG: hypothetical protein JWM68_4591 [Verrucomicrobiales bacterium]|nr:hypothetical protein [Verrucomicrobiales bacterium]
MNTDRHGWRKCKTTGKSISDLIRVHPCSSVVRICLFVFGLVVCQAVKAGPQPLHTNAPPVTAAITNTAITKIDAGIFQIGKVRLDKNKRTVSFPASVNMREGNIEYLLVHTTGKVHESLFKTETEPYHLKVAMLLLGAKGGVVKTKTPEKKTSEISGDRVDLFVTWKTNETEMKFRAEDLVMDVETKATAARGNWIYNGSRIIDGTFLAQRDGSFVSTIADPDALVNNPRPGRDNDDAWLVNTTNTPPVNTSVQIIFQLQNGQ